MLWPPSVHPTVGLSRYDAAAVWSLKCVLCAHGMGLQVTLLLSMSAVACAVAVDVHGWLVTLALVCMKHTVQRC